MAEWIHSQMVVAAGEDYGKDISHVERLIKTLDSFLAGVLAEEERVGRVSELAAQLASEQNINQQKIVERAGETVQLWDNLRELATVRSEALGPGPSRSACLARTRTRRSA